MGLKIFDTIHNYGRPASFCRRQNRNICARLYYLTKLGLVSNCLSLSLFLASTKFQLSLTSPDFSRHRVEDLFRGLGPVAIFSAKHHWTAPRTVTLRSPHNNNNNITSSTNNINENNASNGGGSNNNNNNNAGLGFSVRGDGPVVVAAVESTSLADVSTIFCKYYSYLKLKNWCVCVCVKLLYKVKKIQIYGR